MTFFTYLQEVPFNTTFYKSPIVILSVNHEYNLKVKGSRPPENNIISAWLEVSLPFYSNLRKQLARHFARRHHQFSHKMRTEPRKPNFTTQLLAFPWKDVSGRVQKFHTDDMYFPDQESASDWSCCKIILFNQSKALPAQMCVMTHHQYAISALVPQTSFHLKASNCVMKRGFPHWVIFLMVTWG